MYATAYPMVELANAVATRMKALRTAVILDTCYSGGAAGPGAPAGRNLPTRLRRGHAGAHDPGNGPDCDRGQPGERGVAREHKLRHGYFTYYLLQALKNGKGLTPLSQVYAPWRSRFRRASPPGCASASGDEPEFGGCGLFIALACDERGQHAALVKYKRGS